MNVILNIEIKTQLSLSEKIEFLNVLREQLSEHVLDANLINVLVTSKNILEKNIYLKLSVPIELDECGRRKSATCYIGKYLDKWIEKLQPNVSNHSEEIIFNQKMVDLSILPIKKYNEKYKTDLPESFKPGVSYSGIYINQLQRPKI